MNRPHWLFPLFLLALQPLAAKELEGVYSAAEGPCPTVEEAIAKMSVPEGYAVRCFASEPMIINPVAMTWDSRGRLWVVELYEYPSGAKNPNDYSKTATDEKFRPVIARGEGSPRDRVVILEDTDNDGKADKRTVFVEGLNLATAILCGYDGVFVGQAPNMFFFRDTNGDDKADEYKTVLTGFGLEDRHELLNSFTWGPDGWMYFTHGVFTHSKVRRPEQKPEKGMTLTAGVFRVKLTNSTAVRSKAVPALSPEQPSNPPANSPSPTTPEPAPDEAGTDLATGLETGPTADDYEVYADGTSNPWGVDFDARGNAFVEACVIDHFFHMAPGGNYARQGGTPENPYAYELLPSIVAKDHPRHFRAAYAGISIYQGGVYPEDTHGHAFFGNIHDNAIHEEAMDPVGSTFKARPIRDFLRANNGWFRPVSIQTGPDGFLWVMDWCDKYPCYQNAQANPEGVDRERGRIWRVCYTGSPEGKDLAEKSREQNFDLRTFTPSELAALISDKNSWMSRASMMEMKFRSSKSKADYIALAGALHPGPGAEFHPDDLKLLNAFYAITPGKNPYPIWMSISTLAVDLDNLVPLANSEFAKDAAKWIRLLDDEKEYPLLEKIITAFDDAPVVNEVMVALRRWCRMSQKNKSSDIQWRILATAIRKAPNCDRTTAFSLWQAMEPQLSRFPKTILENFSFIVRTAKPLSLTLTNKTARRITDSRSAENMDLLLAFMEKINTDDELTAEALEGMLKAQEAGALKPAKTDPAPFFALWQKSSSEKVRTLSGRLATLWGDPNAIAALMGTVLNPDADNAQRLEAIRTVRRLKSDTARAGILKLLGTKTPDNLTTEAIRAAGELGGLDLANEILAAWPNYSPTLKNTAAEVFVTRQDWANRLLDAVEGKWIASGKIDASGIPVSVRRSFAQNKELKDRATQLLGSWNESADDVKALIAAKRKACVQGEPDLALGKILFSATCATCHTFQGTGQQVGPDLTGSGRSNLDAILANVIDPNQIIGNGYQTFIITTKDGRTLAGRIVEDTPTQVTLLGIGGSREVVPVADISKKEDTGLSLMPMGFGALPDEQFRSLIWYILSPPEEGPLTPEKKAALIREAESDLKEPAAPDKKSAKTFPPIDRESVSLWNPDWKVTAPDFEGTPRKLPDYAGRKNVLNLHPFSDRKNPATLTRRISVPADGKPTLTFDVASGDNVDWELVVTIEGKEVRRQVIGSKAPRWKTQTIDLTPWAGKEVPVSLENHANGWSWEFSYWSNLQVVP